MEILICMFVAIVIGLILGMYKENFYTFPHDRCPCCSGLIYKECCGKV